MKIEIDYDPAELVIEELKDYYRLCEKSVDQNDEIFNAIEVVLSHYLNHEDYTAWYKRVHQ